MLRQYLVEQNKNNKINILLLHIIIIALFYILQVKKVDL